jgi:SAM-dependent methyltransferase
MTRPATASDVYLLGDSPLEIDHLTAQAAVYEPEAQQLLDLVGVGETWASIDIGCGALGILHLLAARCASTFGLDREPRILEQARALMARLDQPVELICADATATGLPSDTFDLTHCRTLLLNVSDPKAVLREMVRITRPGGVVAIQEPDSAAWLCEPTHPAFADLRHAITAAYARNGKDFDIGRKAGRLLGEAGLADVHIRATARATRSGDFYQTFIITLASLLADEVAEPGLFDRDQFDHRIHVLHEHLSRPETITLQPIIWQAWGTKR